MNWYIAYMAHNIEHQKVYGAYCITTETDEQFLTLLDIENFTDDLKKTKNYRNIIIINAFRIK